MPKKTKAQRDRADLLALLPPGAKRIKVKTEMGEVKYVALDDLGDKDEIQVNGKGEAIVMKGRPGRKANVDLQPVNDVVREAVKRKQDAIQKDPLVQVVETDPDSDVVLHEVLKGLTDEVASLAYERGEAERTGKGTSQISVRRINGLKAAADTWLKRRDQIAGKSLDPDGSAFKAAAQFLLETMKEAMSAIGQRPEMTQTIFAKFGQLTASDSWKAELKARIRNS